MRLPALIAVTIVAAGVAAFIALRLFDDSSGPPIIIDDSLADATIVVSVEGAVATPGVYTLQGGARVQDALRAAGGETGEADLAGINLAARLHDEDRLVVPRRAPAGSSQSTSPSATESATPLRSIDEDEVDADVAGLIDINTATAAELETLPGIGEAIAARVVAYRGEHGLFQTIEDLALVDGISPRMVEELRPYLTVSR